MISIIRFFVAILVVSGGTAYAQQVSPALLNAEVPLYVTGVSVGNGADTTEDQLQTYTLPAGQLANVGDIIHITAGGVFAGSTDSKTVKVKFAGAALSIPTGSTVGQTRWSSEVWIVKTGSNTQSFMAVGTNVSASAGTNNGTATATDTNALAVTVTGQNATNSVAGSVTCQYLAVQYIKAPPS
jgi:hypothetical protein